MKTIRRFAAISGLALLAATSLHAEVGVKPGLHGDQVVVQPTEQGPWSPKGALKASLLNPGGDLIGDGNPSVAESGRRSLVAWYRPALDRVVLAEWHDEAWVQTGEWPVGTPVAGLRVLVPEGQGRVITAWQELGSRCTVALGTDDESQPLRLPGERLLAVSLSADRIQLLTLADDGAVLWSTGSLPDLPAPIGFSSRLTLTVLPSGADCLDTGPALQLDAAIDELDSQHSLVSWWDDSRRLAFAVAGPDGLGQISVLEHPGRGVVQPETLRKKARTLALDSLR